MLGTSVILSVPQAPRKRQPSWQRWLISFCHLIGSLLKTEPLTQPSLVATTHHYSGLPTTPDGCDRTHGDHNAAAHGPVQIIQGAKGTIKQERPQLSATHGRLGKVAQHGIRPHPARALASPVLPAVPPPTHPHGGDRSCVSAQAQRNDSHGGNGWYVAADWRPTLWVGRVYIPRRGSGRRAPFNPTDLRHPLDQQSRGPHG